MMGSKAFLNSDTDFGAARPIKRLMLEIKNKENVLSRPEKWEIREDRHKGPLSN